MKARWTFAPLLVGLLAACAPEADEQTAESVETAMPETEASADVLADLRSQYVEHFNLGHAPMVADLYTADAVVLDANGARLSGREAITASLEDEAAMSPNLEVTAADRIVVGDRAVERGSYRIQLTPEGAEPITSTGHYLDLAVMEEGAWKLRWLGVNLDAPPTAPMPVEAGAETSEEAPAADAGPLADLSTAYVEHFNLGHADMVADLFADDAVSMIAERPIAEGRAAIEAMLADRLAAGSPQIELTPIAVETLGEEWVIARGRHTITATANGQTVSRSGNHIVLARRQADGTWKFHWVLSNLEPSTNAQM